MSTMNPLEPVAIAAPTRLPGKNHWLQAALACAVLLLAGGARIWRARQIGDLVAKGSASPFSLKELPMDLGPWHSEGNSNLDPYIASGSGSTDNVDRIYIDDRTGTKLELLVLYGPAVNMNIHAPELCYPKAGYAQTEGPIGRKVTYDGNRTANFSSLIFTKGEGGATERQMVYYAWRYGDDWSPAQLSPRQSERTPGMFKLQLARNTAPRERLRTDGALAVEEDADPCESFLKLLLPEIERRIAARKSATAGNRQVPTPTGSQSEAPKR